MDTIDQTALRLHTILGGGAQTSRRLQSLLGVSQATLSRIIRRNKGSVLTLGAARSTQYALKEPLGKLGSQIPVYQVDETGDVHPFGTLHLLADRKYGWQAEGSRPELVDHLPYFLQNMSPEGFMGRTFAQQMAKEFGLPKKLQEWTDRHVLTALCLRGEDCTGNLIIGRDAAQRYIRQARLLQEEIVQQESRARVYEKNAQVAIYGGAWGSSAGGEQPKFTALLQGYDPAKFQRVIVKFANRETDEGQRWSDLLVCEQIAADLIEVAGFASAHSEIVQTDAWTFLQVDRFDRVERWGRIPLLSLGVVDAEFFGDRDDWILTAKQLEGEQMISAGDAATLQWLSAFGTLIGNTDMHFGNVSLIPVAEKTFRLAPAYDMLPMFYRPRAGGSLILGAIESDILHISVEVEEEIMEWAIRFWERVAQDERITKKFRTVCQPNIVRLKELSAGPRLRF